MNVLCVYSFAKTKQQQQQKLKIFDIKCVETGERCVFLAILITLKESSNPIQVVVRVPVHKPHKMIRRYSLSPSPNIHILYKNSTHSACERARALARSRFFSFYFHIALSSFLFVFFFIFARTTIRILIYLNVRGYEMPSRNSLGDILSI